MIRLHMALPGVGLAIDVAPEHIALIVPCDEGVPFDTARHPGARCFVQMASGQEIYVTEPRDDVRELCWADRQGDDDDNGWSRKA